MKTDKWIDEPTPPEKENTGEPQEEFISDEPPSKFDPEKSGTDKPGSEPYKGNP